MVKTEQVPRTLASATAEDFQRLIAPYVERCAVAGSLRRGAPVCSDIELVVVPKTAPLLNLFGECSGQRNLLDPFLDGLRAEGTLTDRLDVHGRGAWGERYKRTRYQGVALDLFSVIEPAQFGVILTIRTGPSGFSRQLVTSRLYHGWLPVGWKVEGGALHDEMGTVIPTPEETDLFRVLGREWIAPEARV